MIRVRALCAALLFLLLVGSTLPVAAADSAPTTMLLKAARLFDGVHDIVPNGVVIVTGDRIVAVGSGLAIPAGAMVIDLGDATLSPGFIDAHTHLTSEFSGNYLADSFNGMRREVSEQTLFAASYAKKTLEAGFTFVRDVGAPDLIDVGLRNGINEGLVPGPRMYVATYGSARPAVTSMTPPDSVAACLAKKRVMRSPTDRMTCAKPSGAKSSTAQT